MNYPANILLIDDNLMDAELTMRVLKKHPLSGNMLHLKDGQEALDHIESGQNTAELILLDLKMPKVDGIEVLKRLKANPTTRSIPVVILTSSVEPIDVRACYDIGANSFIVKPVKYEAFTKVIDELCHYWTSLNQANH